MGFSHFLRAPAKNTYSFECEVLSTGGWEKRANPGTSNLTIAETEEWKWRWTVSVTCQQIIRQLLEDRDLRDEAQG